MEILTNFQYKKYFLPNINEEILKNNSDIQLYRLEEYIMGIVMPVVPYRTTFNFIIFVTQGSIKQYVENEEKLAQKGELIFIKQGAITATLELSEDLKGFFLVYENNILAKHELLNGELSVFNISSLIKPSIVDFGILKKILSIMRRELWANNFEMCDSVVLMLHLILIKMRDSDKGETHRSITRPMDISLQFRDLLLKHHIKEKRVSFYAKELSLTENYLNKCIKDITLKSPKQWINEMDINYAKALLQTQKNIAEIAYELNFQTASHFTQLFKKVTGLTPKQYRISLI